MKSMILFILLAVLAAATACGPTRRLATSLTDSVRVDVRERTEYIRDTVWRDFPQIIEKVTVRLDSSHLENRYAASDARINPDGTLFHSLATRPQREPLPVDSPVRYRDSIVYKDRVAERIVEVEVERELSWWQKTQIKGFWLLLVGAAFVVGRKKLLTLVQTLKIK